MTERTWGYWAHVGLWYGDFPVPAAERSPPLRAIEYLLAQVAPALAEMHRPRHMSTSWAEYGEGGEQIGFHELEETDVSTWDGLLVNVGGLRQRTSHEPAVATLFVDLDTSVVESGGQSWLDESATWQVSIPPPPDERAAESFQISYDTMIDVWLPTTYGADGLRSNREASAANLPRLEAFLRRFAALVGGALEIEPWKRYGDALTATGFLDLNPEATP